MAAKASTGGSLKLYKSYSFKDHDPILDQLRTLHEDENLSYAKISELSGLSVGTLGKWFNRGGTKPTRRPQFASVMAFTRSLGYDLRIVKPERKVSATSGVSFQRTNVRAKSGLNNGASATAH